MKSEKILIHLNREKFYFQNYFYDKKSLKLIYIFLTILHFKIT